MPSVEKKQTKSFFYDAGEVIIYARSFIPLIPDASVMENHAECCFVYPFFFFFLLFPCIHYGPHTIGGPIPSHVESLLDVLFPYVMIPLCMHMHLVYSVQTEI